MRAYIDGTLSTHQDCFLPDTLWFSSDEDFDFVVNEKTIRLDGLECESGIENNEFSCRWKGVEVCYIKDGEHTETEDITVEEIINMIKEKNMVLINMEAYYDTSVNVKLTKLKLVDEIECEFNTDSMCEIEFVK